MVRLLYLPVESALGVEIDGSVNGADIDHLQQEIDQRVDEHSRIRLLVDIVPKLDGRSVMSSALLTSLKLSLNNRKSLERKAIVADSALVKRFVWIFNMVFRRIDMRYFPRLSRDLAVHWLSINDRALVNVVKDTPE